MRELCDRHDVFLICDEVATGFGRTGTMFACEQEQVSPDFLCLAKGLTGGYRSPPRSPPSAFTRASSAPTRTRTFFHGHATGNPLACAAAIASLDAFGQDLLRLQPKIRLLGELLGAV